MRSHSSRFGESPGDDRLYLELANHLARGAWLGPYNHLTLAKMPFYSMWVAASFGLGMPLLLGEQLLYAASCLTAVVALRPLVKSEAVRVVLFGALLCSPWSFADQVMTRAAREGVYASLGILVFAGTVGLALRQGASRGTLVRWALLLGGSAAALWLTREEGVWIGPMVVFGLCAGGFRTATWRRLAAAAALALVVWSVAIGFVIWKNWTQYGLAVLSEETSGPFVEAFRQMVRVRTSHWRRSVPLPREAREKLYLVSPAFSRLRNYLEGPDQPNWIAIGCNVYGLCDEIGAGAIHFAIRDAAAHEGLLHTGAAARQYWLRVAREIDDACRRRTLDCNPAGAGNAVIDTWRVEHWSPLLESLRAGVTSVLRLQGVRSVPTPSVGPFRHLDIFRDLTRERLAGLDAQVQKLHGTIAASGEVRDNIGLELTDSRGASAEGYVQRSPPSSGRQESGEPRSTFEFDSYCPGGCSLLVRDTRNGQGLGRLALKNGSFSLPGLDLTVNAEPEPSLPRQERLDARRLRILEAITGVYRVVLPVFVALGLLAWLVVGVFALRLHDVRTFWLTCSTALVGFGTRMLLLAIVSAVAFPSMNVLYVSPAPPLLLLFCALALMSAYRVAELWRMPDRLDAAETTSHPGGRG